MPHSSLADRSHFAVVRRAFPRHFRRSSALFLGLRTCGIGESCPLPSSPPSPKALLERERGDWEERERFTEDLR